jgi:thiosulfate/3-mercaptopyruvate sulfurtransferase
MYDAAAGCAETLDPRTRRLTTDASGMNYTTLISVADLAKHLGNADFVIFDCRHELTNPEFGPKAYAESHIPSARFAHVDRDLSGALTGKNGRHPLPDPNAFMNWLGRMGVSDHSQVIGYDHAGGTYASRLWWMLRWVGHQKVASLTVVGRHGPCRPTRDQNGRHRRRQSSGQA